jgi:catechol 2,3-dioxygenase-like lactoylglutathione lyase family enzyme
VHPTNGCGMKNAKIISFVATVKPKEARKFYEETLGLKFVSDDPFAIVFDVNGTMLRVTKVKELVTTGYTVLGWDVADIRAEVEGLVKKGVKFERYEFLEQDELGIWSAPGGAKVAWFRDPDGNTLSLTQFI